MKVAAGARADFHFDGEAVIYFPLEVLPTVAELAGAKKKRRLSEAHKASWQKRVETTYLNRKMTGLKGREMGLI